MSSFQNRIFGTDSENYVGELFGLSRIENGNNLPDFISNDFEIPFLMELKSGRNKKGIINDYQLSYNAFSLQKVLGWSEEKLLEFTEDNYGGQASSLVSDAKDSLALYYNYINRVDSLTKKDLLKNKNHLKITWGNNHIVPYEFIFYKFVTQYSNRTRVSVEDSIVICRNFILSQIKNQVSYSEERKRDKQSWQNLHGVDIETLCLGQPIRNNNRSTKRLDDIRRIYPEIDDLSKTVIQGPNNSQIYLLYYPEHQTVIDALSANVNSNLSKIETISQMRLEEYDSKSRKKVSVDLRNALMNWKDRLPDDELADLPF